MQRQNQTPTTDQPQHAGAQNVAPEASPLKAPARHAMVPLSPGADKAKLHMDVVDSLLTLSAKHTPQQPSTRQQAKSQPKAQAKLHSKAQAPAAGKVPPKVQPQPPASGKSPTAATTAPGVPAVSEQWAATVDVSGALCAARRLTASDAASAIIPVPAAAFCAMFGRPLPGATVVNVIAEPTPGTIVALAAEVVPGGAAWALHLQCLLRGFNAGAGDVLTLQSVPGASPPRARCSLHRAATSDPPIDEPSAAAATLSLTPTGADGPESLAAKPACGGGAAMAAAAMAAAASASVNAHVVTVVQAEEPQEAAEDEADGLAPGTVCTEDAALGSGSSQQGPRSPSPDAQDTAAAEAVAALASVVTEVHALEGALQGRHEEEQEEEEEDDAGVLGSEEASDDPDWGEQAAGSGSGAVAAAPRGRGRPRKRRPACSSPDAADGAPRAAPAPGQCSHCGTTETPRWWKEGYPAITLCNACGIWQKRHNYPRPVQFFGPPVGAGSYPTPGHATTTPGAALEASPTGFADHQTPSNDEFYLINGRPKRRRAAALNSAYGRPPSGGEAEAAGECRSAPDPPINFDAAGGRVFVVKRKLMHACEGDEEPSSALVHFGWGSFERAAHEMFDRVAAYGDASQAVAVEDFELLSDCKATATLRLRRGVRAGVRNWDVLVRQFVDAL